MLRCLRLLSLLHFPSIHSPTFLSIPYFRRQFLRKMWPIQAAFIHMLHVGYSTPPCLSVILLRFSHDRSKWSPPSFCSTALQKFPVISVILSEVSKFRGYKKPCPKCSTSLVVSVSLSPICWWKQPSSCRMPLFSWNAKFNFSCTSCVVSSYATQILEILHNFELFLIYYYLLWGLLHSYSH